jgi:hypothetical protein
MHIAAGAADTVCEILRQAPEFAVANLLPLVFANVSASQ